MRLVLFDIDGTLVDAKGAGRWAIDQAFERTFGLAGVDSRRSGVRFNGRTDPSIIDEIAQRNGVAATLLVERRTALETRYLQLLEERLASGPPARALPGVVDLVAALEADEVPFGLLTGNIRRGAELKLRAIGIERRFVDGAFGSDGPDRSALGRLARERFEARAGSAIDPAEVVVVGDAPEDIRAARANGYRCLAVATGWCCLGELEALEPDHLLGDLSATESVMEWLRRGG